MILLSLAVLRFAVADLLRWSPERVSNTRSFLAITGATAAALGMGGLSGLQGLAVPLVGLATAVVVTLWILSDQPEFKHPGYPLALILVVVLGALAASGSVDTVSGPLSRWYSNLGFPFVRLVTIDQFVLGVSAGMFLLATANRIVRLVLEAAGTPAVKGEATLRGGRVLGPLERLFVFAIVLSGDLTGAAIVIAAKGLLRLPEIRDSESQRNGEDDHVTEYFLIGTFFSLFLAGGLALLVLGAN